MIFCIASKSFTHKVCHGLNDLLTKGVCEKSLEDTSAPAMCGILYTCKGNPRKEGGLENGRTVDPNLFAAPPFPLKHGETCHASPHPLLRGWTFLHLPFSMAIT